MTHELPTLTWRSTGTGGYYAHGHICEVLLVAATACHDGDGYRWTVECESWDRRARVTRTGWSVGYEVMREDVQAALPRMMAVLEMAGDGASGEEG